MTNPRTSKNTKNNKNTKSGPMSGRASSLPPPSLPSPPIAAIASPHAAAAAASPPTGSGEGESAARKDREARVRGMHERERRGPPLLIRSGAQEDKNKRSAWLSFYGCGVFKNQHLLIYCTFRIFN